MKVENKNRLALALLITVLVLHAMLEIYETHTLTKGNRATDKLLQQCVETCAHCGQ